MLKRLLVALFLVASVFAQNVAFASGETNVALHAVADGYADSKYPQSKYGHVEALYVGNSYDHVQIIWGSERIFIRFDLSGLPTGQVIEQATLRLWQYYPPAWEQKYEAHRVLGDWNEGTVSWKNQPSWASVVTSTATAPNRANVAVEWDITPDAKAWYAGVAQNYGTMIKVAEEERVEDASSGFWSREYPAPELVPRLTILLGVPPASEYVAMIAVMGLPADVTSTMTLDGHPHGQISAGREREITFEKGTTHTLAVSDLVLGAEGTRYRCEDNQTQVSSGASHVFIYSTEYLVTFSTEPKDLFRTPMNGWYENGTMFSVSRTGPDLVGIGPGVRLAFDGWYANQERIAEALPTCSSCTKIIVTTLVVTEPLALEGRYRTEYYLNVTSQVGKTIGSGWYAKGSVASFSVDATAVPAEGVLGLLGLRRSFVQWVGSQNLAGSAVEPQGSVTMNAPTRVEAIWRDDWSVVLVNVGVLLVILLCVATAVIAGLRKRHTVARSAAGDDSSSALESRACCRHSPTILGALDQGRGAAGS